MLQEDQIETCKQLLADNPDKIVLPTDVVHADAFSADAAIQIVTADRILDNWLGPGQIGPESAANFSQSPPGAATVFWNGPMGVFELAPFADGTRAVAEAIAASALVLGGRRRRLRGGRAHSRHRRIRLHHISTGVVHPWSSSRAKSSRSCRSGGMNPDDNRRKPLIAGNWKDETFTHLEGIALIQKIAFTLPEKYYDHVEVRGHPPLHRARSAQTLIEGDKLSIVYGAAGSVAYDSGAYTADLRCATGQARHHLRAGRSLRAARVPR